MRSSTKLGAGLTTATIAAAFVLAAVGQPGSAAAQDLPGGTWGLAQAVNLTALSPAGTQLAGGSIQAVSCASPGNCAAIGTVYSTNAGVSTPYPFVLSETGGTWGPPAAVPGIASAPNQGVVTSTVSCAAPGECAASWTYADTNGDGHAYLIDESGGAWGQAQPVTIGTVGTWLSGVSCPAAGDCTAVGDYLDGSVGGGLPFVMDSSAGTWGTPQEVPGVAGLSSPPPVNAGLASVSCTSAGNCVAGGSYHVSSTDGRSHGQPFLAVETGGSWGQALPVAGMTTLNPADMATLRSVSCGAPGDCAATGIYEESLTSSYAWVADESGGNWGPAQQLSAPAASSRTVPYSVSCSQGYCAVAGAYFPASGVPSGGYKAFVATYASGAWTAQDVPGVAGTSGGGADTVSCGAPGYCTAGGYYYPPGSGVYKAFVVNDVNGTWASSQDAGVVTRGVSQIYDLSCTTPGYCTAVGLGGTTTFTVSEATAATVTLTASAPTVTYGNEEAETLTATVSSPAGGTSAGTVTVSSGSSTVCTIALAGGTGSCSFTPSQFPVGTFTVTGSYSGDANYIATSGTASVTVAKGNTATGLALAKTAITYGSETVEKLTASVSHAGSVYPSGTVEVKSGASIVCTITLANGAGSCTLTANRLIPGTYHLVAVYSGDGNYLASASAPASLTVAKAKTTTGLALAKTAITYGHETVEKLTASVSHAGSVYPSGTVEVKSGASIVCTITLANGAGSCTLTANRLIPGTYHLVAVYLGNANYLPSASAAKTLTVVGQ
jgi:hypothetical protein